MPDARYLAHQANFLKPLSRKQFLSWYQDTRFLPLHWLILVSLEYTFVSLKLLLKLFVTLVKFFS